MVLTRDEIIKEEILAAAQRLFQQFGIRKTTMEDIARHICKGKSTLYYYYCSKEEIFDAVVHKEMEEVLGKTRQAVENATTAEAKLKAYSVTKMQTLRGMSNLYQMVRLEMLENPPCHHYLHKEYEEREIKLITQILQFGIDNGEFHERLYSQLDIMPYIIMSSLKGFEFDLFSNNKFDGIENRFDAIVDLLLKGLKNNEPVHI
ncbi:TetR/AcrR family transcriptional regulator [soil metagenome]